MGSDDLRGRMEAMGDRFDFGEYEIEAYLAVLDHGEVTASDIADYTSIPQPRVYDTVRKLSDRGMVELRESRPMRVVALDPADVFPDVKRSLDVMVEELATRYTAPARDTEAVSLVKSRPSILRYLESVIESAEYELTCSLTPDLLERFEGLLATAIEDDVTVELLVTPAADTPSPEEYDYAAVATVARARRGLTTPVMAVADGQRSVYATQDALDGGEERYGVIFNRSSLGFLVSGFFSTVLWTTAEPLVEHAGRRPFPRQYASIRRCLADLEDETRALHARIRGRDVVTGDPRVAVGRIADLALEPTAELATLTLVTDDDEVTVGGRVAALEDMEAHEIVVDTEPLE
ncbi:HTH-type sugar sensing transcriptional regulator TrmB [Halomarina ordinaria]|uniref:HTH-type sugar sensing transcriptional regulator TrmB n=1 Tax=Halomarina ordinaria TaxID=3033939 RepID=A0ABD5U608_9EURY|nr:TrmB family transcriptional regulator [Halomarina sp. PSRA2]